MRKSYDGLSARQLGLVTSSQLGRLGWSHHAMLDLARRELLFPVRRQVWHTAGSPVTPEQPVLAAVLAAGDGALVSHASAARLWGFDRVPVPGVVHLVTDSWSQPRLLGVGAVLVTSAGRTIDPHASPPRSGRRRGAPLGSATDRPDRGAAAHEDRRLRPR